MVAATTGSLIGVVFHCGAHLSHASALAPEWHVNAFKITGFRRV
jgi:hypothetical protein